MKTFAFLFVLSASAVARPTIDFATDGFNHGPGQLSLREIEFEIRQENTASSIQRSWEDALKKAEGVVAQLTISEKLNLTSGQGMGGKTRCTGVTGAVPRFGIPEICFEDGPTGVRPVDGVTAFPPGVTIASTWDRDLMYSRSVAIGKEFYGKGVNVALGPVTGGPIGRTPFSGRNWEGWSPDPYLTGVASYITVSGIQASGVIACAKHFIGYEQQTWRNPYSDIDSKGEDPFNNTVSGSADIDERTVHELYLPGFMEAIRAGVGSIMCAYNRVNGTYACEDKETLTKVLRDQLKFPGFVVSDWWATHHTIGTATGGMDVEMPGPGYSWRPETPSFLGESLKEAIDAGRVDISYLDAMVLRYLTTWYRFGHDDASYPEPNFNVSSYYAPGNKHVNVQKDHYKVALEVATDGTILLKNEGALPIKNFDRIAVFGSDAGQAPQGPWASGAEVDFSWHLDKQVKIFDCGTQFMGAGSGWARPPYVIDPLSAIQQRVRKEGGWLTFQGGDFDVGNTYQEITQMALAAQACLVFVSATATEGYDIRNLTLVDAGDQLIQHVASSCSNTIVVMHVPGPTIVNAWKDHENVTAIVNANIPGQESGNAIASVLFGDVNPSGKLVYTIASNEADYIQVDRTLRDNVTVEFTEKLLIDYRSFDATNKLVDYEFGFGLSYTNWTYSGLSVKAGSGSSPSVHGAESDIGGNHELFKYVLSASATIKNTGAVTGHEVAQLYVSYPAAADEPIRVLRGFDKVKNVAPGSSATAKFQLTKKDLSVYDPTIGDWKIVEGTYTIYVGKSSRKLDLVTSVEYSGQSWNFGQ